MLPISSAVFAPSTSAMATPAFTSVAQRVLDCLDAAPHLGARTASAKTLATELMRSGYVQVPETEHVRWDAVAGVQWAMERTLDGTQFIVTAERATPFRTHGDDPQAPAQYARKLGLLARLNRGDPLHLVFCQDGVGTAQQDAAYRLDILQRYGPDSGLPVLQEHALPWGKADFPDAASGAFILGGAGSPAFAVHAAQAQHADEGRSIELFFGVMPASGSALAQKLGYWHSALKDWCGLDCMAPPRPVA
ncbi:hypothetical protein [Pseudoxanthomonas sp. UTMC 1351]|uniref:hypothetical protein n=1 Tax=Pseudoxanthomonas sp. UTMC 1351 TaxID=2695853 RepID=UPI0034CFDFC2